MRTLFTILFNAGADLVLNGHNHQYEGFALQRPDGARDDPRGIREFVPVGGSSFSDAGAEDCP
jgi:hypothetical protein